VIVLITLLFAATALVAFLDKAGTDLLVVSRAAVADRLRVDAYSALEVTLAVLEDFRQAGGGLHSPSEGWSDPLGWAAWSPEDGNTVEVSFQDESGKIPLMHVDPGILVGVFENWQMPQSDSQHLADVLLAWMQQNYLPTSGIAPDYEQSTPAFDPPERSMRSYSELAAIDFAKDVFFDKAGRPNDLWWRFHNDFSIFNFPRPNINGANADVLAGLGQCSDNDQQNISDYLNGSGGYKAVTPLGKQWFTSSGDVSGVVGSQGNSRAFASTIAALRILITVHDGSSQYHLSAVVAPQGGATTVQTTATDVRKGASGSTSGATASNNGLATTPTQTTSTATNAQTAAASTAAANLQYPFTILEIGENDEILTAPPPPPPPHS